MLYLMILVAGLSMSGVPQLSEELIFAPEPLHNHSSSIVETPRGDLLACWFHGKGERSDDTLLIQGARKRRGGKSWSAPFTLADNQNLPDQNSVFFIDPQKRLWLFWISSLDNELSSYLLKYRISTHYTADGPPKWDWQDVIHCRPKDLDKLMLEFAPKVPDIYGASFDSDPKYRKRLAELQERAKSKLWCRLGWMPRCQPIMLSEKRMMLGLYSDIFLCSMAAFTEDGGKTWEFGQPTVGYGCIQPALIRKKNGDVVAYMRDKSPAKRIRTAASKDGGMTWSAVRDLEIPNPDSSVSCVALKSGNWVLICNDTTGGERGGRTRLTAFLSDDEGSTWKWSRRMEELDGSCAAAYPTVIQARDGVIHCVYTYSPSPNETIKHVWFNEDWIRAGGS